MSGRSRKLSEKVLEQKAAVRRRLRAWFARDRRDLPWRRTKDPYRIWVSEIMLQQTRVEAAVPYYRRFLKAFPTVRRLAAASQDRVLKAWEGLGYYARARNLLRAARTIVKERGGRFPESPGEWRELPGIGPYTAAAISSIAFGFQAAAVDGNVKRVFARLFGLRGRIGSAKTEKDIQAIADALVPPGRPGDFNQAVMELGARVCTPRSPSCGACPLGKHCRAYRRGEQELLPRRKPGRSLPHVNVVAAVIRRRGRVLIGRRPPRGLLGGLWEFPGGKVGDGETREQALCRELGEELAIRVRPDALLGSVEHAYSHFRITLHLYDCTVLEGDPLPRTHTALKWVFPSAFGRYAFPAATVKAFIFLDPD
jgi:A/G-specific adenine glycosylase